MTFLAGQRLWMLLLVAAAVAAYVFLQQRRRHYAVRFTNLELLASVAPRRPGWRRHLPAAAMALAVVALITGLARPATAVRVPKESATVMLVLDASASMSADDVAPSRLEAATAAAGQFIAGLPVRMRVGLVAFDRTPRLLAEPTADHTQVTSALRRITVGPGTATGEAIFVALDVLAGTAVPGVAGDSPAAIVLLSDGATTIGRPLDQAAAAAAEAKVTITTIAFGTPDGTVDVGGRQVPVPSDPQSMQALAQATSGKAFEAYSAEQLRSVYRQIGSRVGYETKQKDISLVFVFGGTALLLAAMVLSMVWTGRLL